MTQERLVIGSRGSDLALFQANFIRDLLLTVGASAVDIRIIKTMGDKIDQVSFEEMEGKGFFTKELEEALLNHEIDLAVHSLKDLMTAQPAGLKLGAVGYRADRREMLLVRPESRRDNRFLPVRSGAVIGTSSARRKAQIWFHDSSLVIKDLRGNLPTRVKKLRDGRYDAILVATAGVQRLKLDLSGLDAALLSPEEFLPAPAQGILGMQIRDDDARVESVVSRLGSREAAIEASLERGLLASFDGGCSLPLGVYSQVTDGTFRLKANLGRRDGDQWTGLKWIDVVGSDIATVIAQAHEQLCTREADCA